MGILTKPVVDPEVGHNVEQSNLPSSHLGSQVVERAADNQKANISDGNQVCLGVGEESAERVKVAVTKRLGAVCLLGQTLGSSADIEHQVELPSKDLVAQKSNCVVQRSFLKQLLELLDHGRHLALALLIGGRNEDGVLLDVAVITVVSRMGDLPREVRHHEQGVSSPANNVVQHGVRGESAMSTLVAKNPDSNANAALDESIGNPGTGPLCGSRQEIDMKSCIYEHRSVDEVADKVGERPDRRALKAMSRNLASQESIGDLLGLYRVSAIAIDMLESTETHLSFALQAVGHRLDRLNC